MAIGLFHSIKGILEVRKCPHGRGVFATKSFERGELIWKIEGVRFTTAPRSPAWKRWAIIVGRTSAGEPLFWDEEPKGSPDYWSNFLDHSEKPNVRFFIDDKRRVAYLRALRSVGIGEELFLDYKEYDSENWSPGQETDNSP